MARVGDLMLNMISRATILIVAALSLLTGIFLITSRRPEERDAAPGYLVLGAGLILVLVFV